MLKKASAIRHDRIRREFYQRLPAAGKVKMVALTAVMRKLVVLLNPLLAKPGFQLRGAAPAPAPSKILHSLPKNIPCFPTPLLLYALSDSEVERIFPNLSTD